MSWPSPARSCRDARSTGAQFVPERDKERDPRGVLLEQRAQRDPLLDVRVVERVGEAAAGWAHAVCHVGVGHEREAAALRAGEDVLDHVGLDS